MPKDPRLDAALAVSRQERDDALSSIRAMTANIRRDHNAFREQRRGRDAERAERARSGELGPEMQTLQRRIDAGETTWDDVLAGRDDHPSAQVARENMQRNLTEVSETVRADPGVAEEAAELEAAQQRLDDETTQA